MVGARVGGGVALVEGDAVHPARGLLRHIPGNSRLTTLLPGALVGPGTAAARHPRKRVLGRGRRSWTYALTRDALEYGFGGEAGRVLREALLCGALRWRLPLESGTQLAALKRSRPRGALRDQPLNTLLGAAGGALGTMAALGDRAGDARRRCRSATRWSRATPTSDGCSSTSARRAAGADEALDTPYGTSGPPTPTTPPRGVSSRFIEDFIRSEVMPTYGTRTPRRRAAAGRRRVFAKTRAKSSARHRRQRGRRGHLLRDRARPARSTGRSTSSTRAARPTRRSHQLSDAIPADERPVVFVGPYEHHSNELPWRTPRRRRGDRRRRRRAHRPRRRSRTSSALQGPALRSVASRPRRTSRHLSDMRDVSRRCCTATARSRSGTTLPPAPTREIEMDPRGPDGQPRLQGRGVPVAAQAGRRPGSPACSSSRSA